jgi:hypothetical protein
MTALLAGCLAFLGGLAAIRGSAQDQQPGQEKPDRAPASDRPQGATVLDVVNVVEGRHALLVIAPEGSLVRKGALVAELDSSLLRDRLTTQVITTRRAFADLEQAQKQREIAEIAVTEYLQGIYPMEEEALASDTRIAQAELLLARDELDEAEKTPDRELPIKRARLALMKAERNLRRLQVQLDVLRRYTKDARVKQLQADVEKALSNELAAKATYELEKSKEEKLNRQIEACKLYAPADGMVLHPKGRLHGEPGVEVGERYIVARIVVLDQAGAKPR